MTKFKKYFSKAKNILFRFVVPPHNEWREIPINQNPINQTDKRIDRFYRTLKVNHFYSTNTIKCFLDSYMHNR